MRRRVAFQLGGNATKKNIVPSNLRMEAELKCLTLVTGYQITRCHILGDSNHDACNRRSKKHKSCNIAEHTGRQNTTITNTSRIKFHTTMKI